MVDVSSLWQYFVAGDGVGFIEAIFTQNVGNTIFAIIGLLGSIVIYHRTQSPIYVLVIWAILGSFMVLTIPPVAWMIIGPIMVLVFAGLLFYLYRRIR